MKIRDLKNQLSMISKIIKAECKKDNNEIQILELIMLSAKAEICIRNSDTKNISELSKEMEKEISNYNSNQNSFKNQI